MKRFHPSRRAWRSYAVALLGSFLLAFGLYNVHSQSAITEGGVLGGILLVQHWLHISPGYASVVLDLTCYLVGAHYLGRDFLKHALFSTLAFSVFYRILECFPPLFPAIGQYPLAAAVVGALFVGIGAGLVVRAGGACGGDDALALIINHFTHWDIARCYMVTDFTVLLLSLTYIPVVRILYSLITVTLSSLIISWVQQLGRKKAAR